jgi:hypothetical protein
MCTLREALHASAYVWNFCFLLDDNYKYSCQSADQNNVHTPSALALRPQNAPNINNPHTYKT